MNRIIAEQQSLKNVFKCMLSLVSAIFLFSCQTRKFEQSKLTGSVKGAYVTPENLDALLNEANISTIDELISSSSVLEKYKAQMQLMQGEKLTSEKFDWVWQDVQRVAKQPNSEQFKKQSWTLSSSNKFVLKGTKKNLPIFPSSDTLVAHLETWLSAVNAQAKTVTIEQAQKNSSELLEKHTEIETNRKEGNKEANKNMGLYFKDLKNSSEAKNTASYVFSQSLTKNRSVLSGMESSVSAGILVPKLIENAEQFAQQNGLFFPGILELIKDSAPDSLKKASQVVQNSIEQTFEQTFELVPATKALHTFWKGVPCDECVGGERKDSVTPERWATATLTGTRFFFVYLSAPDVPKKYVGFIQLVPIKSTMTGEVYGSVEAGSPDLTATLTFQFPGGKSIKTTAIEAFLLAYSKQKPSEWAGFTKSNAGGMNNGGVGNKLQSSQGFKDGTPIGGRNTVEHFDTPFANFLISQGHKRDSAGVYGGKMITDATIAGNLGRSASDNRVLNFDSYIFQTTELFSQKSQIEAALEKWQK